MLHKHTAVHLQVFPLTASHAGAGLVCCILGLLCIRLLLTAELPWLQDLLIQEKEKLYVELKNILARQPGPEVAEQLSLYQVSSFAAGGQLHRCYVDRSAAAASPQVYPVLSLAGAWVTCVRHACPESRSSHVVRGCCITR